jgi:hypothetical protein
LQERALLQHRALLQDWVLSQVSFDERQSFWLSLLL